MRLNMRLMVILLSGVIGILLLLALLQRPISIQKKAQEIPISPQSNITDHQDKLINRSELVERFFPNGYEEGKVIVKLKNVSLRNNELSSYQEQDMDIEEIISNDNDIDRLSNLFSNIGVQEVSPIFFESKNLYVELKLSESSDVESTIEELYKDESVEYAEPNYIYYSSANITDEYFLDRSPPSSDRNLPVGKGWWNRDFDYQWNMKSISFPKNLPPYSQSTIVAIIDGGVDYNHRELSSHIWSNNDEIASNRKDDDRNGYVDDIRGWDAVEYVAVDNLENPRMKFTKVEDNDPMDDATEPYFKDLISPYAKGGGHGTHIAGIVSASVNGYGGIGVAPGITIMPLRVLTAAGWGFDTKMAKMIVYAADNGARVINLSIGLKKESQLVHDAVKYAHSKDVVIVTSAGNDGVNDTHFPSQYEEVVSVGSIDVNGNKSAFSNYGKVDVVAPGEYIMSTRSQGTDIDCLSDNNCVTGKIRHTNSIVGKNLDHYISSGTSMSAPHVVGLAGLILNFNPSLTAQQVKDIIYSSADDLGSKNKDPFFGYGKINVTNALKKMNIRLPEPEKKRWVFKTKFVCQNGIEPWESSSSMYVAINSDKGGGKWEKSDDFFFKKPISETSPYVIETLDSNSIVTLRTMRPDSGNALDSLKTLQSVPHEKMHLTDNKDELYWTASDLPSGEYTLTYQVRDIYCVPYDWKVKTSIACENGEDPEEEESQLLYLVWPPNPRKWQILDPTNDLNQEISIHAGPTLHKIYLAMRDRAGVNFKPKQEVIREGELNPLIEYVTFSNYGSRSKYPIIDWLANDTVIELGRKNWMPIPEDGVIVRFNFTFYAPETWCDGVPNTQASNEDVFNEELANEVAINDLEVKSRINPTNTPTNLSSDINKDGVTNSIDLLIVSDDLGMSGDNLESDINHDGLTNALDVSIVMTNFGT